MLTGVEVQAEKYAAGMPDALPALHRPLPLLYQSTGVETRFTYRFDPSPPQQARVPLSPAGRSGRVVPGEPLWLPMVQGVPDPLSSRPSTLRTRLQAMPSVEEKGLWPAQLTAVRNSLDLLLLRDESLEDSENLPPPDVIAAEIIEDLRAALEQFAEVQADLTATRATPS